MQWGWWLRVPGTRVCTCGDDAAVEQVEKMEGACVPMSCTRWMAIRYRELSLDLPYM